jgi:hypothetical protein
MKKKVTSLLVIIAMGICSLMVIAQTMRDSSANKGNKTSRHYKDTSKSNFRGDDPAQPYRIIQTDTIHQNKNKVPIKRQPVSPRKEKNNQDTIKQSREQIKMRKDTVNSNPYKETNPVK